jgi:hypothetical protein
VQATAVRVIVTTIDSNQHFADIASTMIAL